jgi:hypothetical protein
MYQKYKKLGGDLLRIEMRLELLQPQNEGNTIVRNVGNYSRSDTGSHLRRLDASATQAGSPSRVANVNSAECLL